MIVTDRKIFEPVKAGVYMLHALLALYPDDFKFREARLDRLVQSPIIREQLQAGKHPSEIIQQWDDQLERFLRVRKKYLIY
jgi:uncharacterized protein YbbC (DUF1343 family)